MKKIKTIDAVGHVLCHDISEIIKDVRKGVAYKKGHVIRDEDVDRLLSLGKDNVYIYEKKAGMIHENEAAKLLSEMCLNDNMLESDISEGKIEIRASIDGFFRVDVSRLNEINMQEDMMIATRKGNIPVKKGEKLAGMRVIPLIIEEDKLLDIKEKIGARPILELIPFKKLSVGMVTTGNEVYYERIKDTFSPVIREKLKNFNLDIKGHKVCPDKTEEIKSAIIELREMGCDFIICTGGMSVDPDDLTAAAIKKSGANIVSYGSPVLPGAMFLLGYFDDGGSIVGVPACGMYMDITIFDIILPYIVAGVEINKEHLAKLGYGGLCLGCDKCTYPNCQFGKGV